MRFVEAVGGEFFDLIKDPDSCVVVDPFLPAAAHEFFPLPGHLFFIFFPHRAAQHVALAERIAGQARLRSASPALGRP